MEYKVEHKKLDKVFIFFKYMHSFFFAHNFFPPFLFFPFLIKLEANAIPHELTIVRSFYLSGISIKWIFYLQKIS